MRRRVLRTFLPVALGVLLLAVVAFLVLRSGGDGDDSAATVAQTTSTAGASTTTTADQEGSGLPKAADDLLSEAFGLSVAERGALAENMRSDDEGDQLSASTVDESSPPDPSIDITRYGLFVLELDDGAAATLEERFGSGGEGEIRAVGGGLPLTPGRYAVGWVVFSEDIATFDPATNRQYAAYVFRTGIDPFLAEPIDPAPGTNLWFYADCPAGGECAGMVIDPSQEFTEVDSRFRMLAYANAAAWVIPLDEVGDDASIRFGGFFRTGDVETSPAGYDGAPWDPANPEGSLDPVLEGGLVFRPRF